MMQYCNIHFSDSFIFHIQKKGVHKLSSDAHTIEFRQYSYLIAKNERTVTMGDISNDSIFMVEFSSSYEFIELFVSVAHEKSIYMIILFIDIEKIRQENAFFVCLW